MTSIENVLSLDEPSLNESRSQAALGSWLDSESSFRLTVEKAKEATDGADYARQQYEKYSTAYQTAKETLDQILKQNADERNGLLDERDLIKQIMRMIGRYPTACPNRASLQFSLPFDSSPTQVHANRGKIVGASRR